MRDVVDQVSAPREEARRFGRATGVLSVGVGVAGLLTYLYVALASHLLGRVGYGEIAVLWSAVFITVSTIFRPVELLLSRSIAEHHARHEATDRSVRVAVTIQAGVALAFAALAIALRSPIENGLLSGDSTLYVIFLTAVLGYGVAFVIRGFLAGNRRFGAYAALLLLDACARLVFPVGVALGIASGRNAVALGVVAAPITSLFVLGAVLGRDARGPHRTGVRSPLGDLPAERGALTFARGGGFTASVLVILLSEQVFLNAGPLLVRTSIGVAEAGFIFNVLMLARAPVFLFQAAATSLLPHLTRLRSHGTEGGEEAFRVSVAMTIGCIAILTGLVAAIVLAAGPALMQVAFGTSFSYDRAGLLIVTAGMGSYLAAATFNQAALARGYERRAAVCYGACAAMFVAISLSPILDELRRIEVGFTVGVSVLCALLYLLYRRSDAPVAGAVKPEPAEEAELLSSL